MINFDTAVGKGIKTLLWAAGSAAVIALLSTIVNKPELFNPILVVIANTLLVLVKNIWDKDVANV